MKRCAICHKKILGGFYSSDGIELCFTHYMENEKAKYEAGKRDEIQAAKDLDERSRNVKRCELCSKALKGPSRLRLGDRIVCTSCYWHPPNGDKTPIATETESADVVPISPPSEISQEDSELVVALAEFDENKKKGTPGGIKGRRAAYD